MQVKKIMTKNPACCTPDSTLQEVAHMMEMYDCGCIPVVDDHQSKRPVGTITDRDITVRTFSANKNPLEMKASDVMTTDIVTISPDTHIYECLKVMEDKQIRRVLVVDKNGKCAGIVAQADLVEHGTNSAETVGFIREVSESDRSFDRRGEFDRGQNYQGRETRRDDRSYSYDESPNRSRKNYPQVSAKKESYFNSTMLLSLLGSIGLGAGLRYYFGPEGKQRTLSTAEVEAARLDIKNATTDKTTEARVQTVTTTVQATATIPPATDATEVRDTFGAGVGSFDKTSDDSDLKPMTEVGRTATNT